MKTTLIIKLLVLSFFTGSFIFTISGCGKSDAPVNTQTCGSVPKTFSADVNPIIQSFCNQAGCHAPGSVNGPGPLTNYTEVFAARNKIRVQIQAGLMPQNATLTATQKNAIICWIDSGAPAN
jgi:hypothetical protein